MVGGVVRVDVEDLLEEGVGGDVAVDGDSFSGKLPDADAEEGFGFDVTRVFVDEVFEVAEEFLVSFFGVLGFAVQVVVAGFDVELVLGGGFVAEVVGFFDEFLGAFFVFPIGHGHAPVCHGAVGVVGGDLAEGSLGLVIPKAVELADALVEVVLSLIPR